MIDFSGYTKQAIEADMLAQVDPNIDTREGSMVQTAVAPGAWWLEGMYEILSNLQQNAYVSTAVGKYLDLLCTARGLVRKPATPAVRQGTFLDDNSDPVTIPTGSRFKTINGEDSVVFVSGDLISAGVYELTCETPGVIGNSYTGAILPITAINGLASATIGTIITVGAEEETDEALRARYEASLQAQAGSGNIASYYDWILKIPGVGAMQIYTPWNSLDLHIYIILLDDDYQPASQELKDEVKAIINPQPGGAMTGDGLAPIGASILYKDTTPVDLDVALTITWETGRGGADDIQAVKDAIKAYIRGVVIESWGSYVVSGGVVQYNVDVYISRLTSAVLNVDGVVNVTSVTINGSSADYTSNSYNYNNSVLPQMGTVTIS